MFNCRFTMRNTSTDADCHAFGTDTLEKLLAKMRKNYPMQTAMHLLTAHLPTGASNLYITSAST